MKLFASRAVVALVILALVAFAVPAPQAQAGTLDRGPALLHVDGPWLHAVLAWLGITPMTPAAPAAPEVARPLSRAAAIGDGSSTTAGPMTGSCIDPQGGGPRCGGG